MITEARSEAAYGAQMAKYFRLRMAPSLVIQPSAKPPVAITRLISQVGLPERTEGIPPERAFVVSVHLTPASAQGCDIWVDDRHSNIAQWPAGGVGIYDLESNPRTRNRGPVDWIHFHVPRSTLVTFADDLGAPRISTLKSEHGEFDQVLYQLTHAILPSLVAPQAFSQLFLDYFRLLFCAHITQKYAPSSNATVSRPSGGLAPWQKRRVLDFLAQHLDDSIALTALASECGLSVSHFARAFRKSFGIPPHRYLVLQRIERAKTLLAHSTSALAEVAQQSGFCDQALFSRTFKSVVGTTPGQWRRQNTTSPGITIR